ncbi:protein TASOR-like [Microcaecilia unicolor]|uniref:Protein TASOR-like n=1 Tax=Microcaecilia unicolor TaxID=1415580 RepID=A0A6P7Y8G6_9AMPH|nr:protein TASOR-like [Microcaecilia unicolor]
MFSSYCDNGIIVTTVEEFMQNFTSLVGYHNCAADEHCPLQIDDPQKQSEKDEEDMSLDSEDEMPQIEVCESKYEPLKTEAEGNIKEISQTEIQMSSEPQRDLMLDKSKIGSEDVQPITPVSISSVQEETDTIEEVSGNNFQGYHSRPIKISHQFSHFNVLTHQTFLGTGMGSYPIPNQNEDVNFFMSPYDQGMSTDMPPSAVWDKK